MNPIEPPPRFWINWLIAVTGGVVVFGLALVTAPALARHGFSLLVYSSAGAIDAFGQEPVRYISLTHAVIGGVMVGWGMALLYVTTSLLRKGSRVGWNVVALSVVAWFVPDTGYSLWSGYWQNALLNAAFFALFALPLCATRASAQNDA